MKIEPGRTVGSSSTAGKAGKTAAPGFAPSGVEAPPRASATAPATAVTPLDAILALQGGESPAQRRARQKRRGDEALDVLEELEHGLLMGRAPAGLRGQLAALQRRAESSGDPGLDAVLQEIDIRLAVEAAKLDRIAGKV